MSDSDLVMKHSGFTLIELLVAAAIAALAATVILGGFAAGIRVWERARGSAGPESAARTAVEIVRKDMCNLTPCRNILFQGGRSWVEIPSIVGSGSNAWPGKIRYECGGGRLDRATVCTDASGRSLVTRETLVSGIREEGFSYADAGPDGWGTPSWVADWSGRTNLPVAVGIAFSVPAGKEFRQVQATVILPRRYPMRDAERRN